MPLPPRFNVSYVCPLGRTHTGSAEMLNGMIIVAYRSYQKGDYLGRKEPGVHARFLLRLLVKKAEKATSRSERTDGPVSRSKL
jgi:hypothetical protein